MKTKPHLQFEIPFWKENMLVAGIDEVGRGSFAGPLVSAGVILKPILKPGLQKYLFSFGINDSKLITKRKRELIKDIAQEFILYSTIKHISVSIINEKGIGFANKLAFDLVAEDILKNHPNSKLMFLTDAFKIPTVPQIFQRNIIRGDSTSVTIALASILAKVERDTFMENLANEFPEFEFEKHKGYGTKKHRENLKLHGSSPMHRIEFIKSYI